MIPRDDNYPRGTRPPRRHLSLYHRVTAKAATNLAGKCQTGAPRLVFGTGRWANNGRDAYRMCDSGPAGRSTRAWCEMPWAVPLIAMTAKRPRTCECALAGPFSLKDDELMRGSWKLSRVAGIDVSMHWTSCCC